MATPDTGKISVLEGKVTGAIFVAPVSVPLPTNATSTLPSSYKCVGFTSDDGIVISEDASTKSLRAWEGKTEVRNTTTEYTEQMKFTPVECNEEVAKLTWGEDHVEVASNGNLTIKHHGESMPPVHVVIEAVPFTGAVARYCAKAQLTERGEVAGNGEDYSGRELTFNCLGVDGVTMTEHIAFTTTASAPTSSGGSNG